MDVGFLQIHSFWDSLTKKKKVVLSIVCTFILFNFAYINDLSSYIPAKYVLYAHKQLFLFLTKT